MSRDQSLELLTRMERRADRLKIGVTIVSGVMIILLMFAFAHYYERPEYNNNIVVSLNDLTETLIKGNSTVYVNPDGYAGYLETLNYNSTLTGAFTSSQPVTFYVLDKTDLLSQNSSGIPSYIYTSGETSSAKISVYLAAGEYYLEFYNSNNSSLAKIQVTQPFTISFST